MGTRTPIALSHETDRGIGSRARIGLIVLQSDMTLETEIRSLPLDGVAISHSRIANDLHVTPETLTAMKQRLPEAASLLPAEFSFDAIGYGCTSASTLIGDSGVASAVHQTHPGIPVTNPIQAAVAGLTALGANRIGVVTPYSADVTVPVIERFESDGVDVAAFGTFGVENDLDVARTTPAAIAGGIRQVAAEAECDAIFVSCTSIRLFAEVSKLEEELGMPIVSSNLALAWHLLRLAGIDDQFAGFGSLFSSR